MVLRQWGVETNVGFINRFEVRPPKNSNLLTVANYLMNTVDKTKYRLSGNVYCLCVQSVNGYSFHWKYCFQFNMYFVFIL